MGIQIKWDRRTRVYITLGVRWKGKVQGLCGNYNGDALDDFKTPSSGIETSASLFGHSWKLQDFCAGMPILCNNLCATNYLLTFFSVYQYQRTRLTRVWHTRSVKCGLSVNAES